MRIVMQLMVLGGLFASVQGFALSDAEINRVVGLINANKGEFCSHLADGNLCKQSEKYGSVGPVMAFRFCRKTSSQCDREINNFRDIIQLRGLKLGSEGDVKSFLERADINGLCNFIADHIPKLKDQCLGKVPLRPAQAPPQLPKKS